MTDHHPKPQVLIFGRTDTGINVPVHVDSSGNLGITATITGADGAIEDGADASIRATVKNYLNSNPLTVVLVDTSGTAYVASGGGGGGAVTIADGADVAEGATTDVAVTGDNAGTVSAKLRGLNKVLGDVWDSVNHWLKVSIQNTTLAVTQSGSWVLSAGSALIGKVGIDQTTPGTTNAVAPISGQNGVAAGAGAVGATTQRVTLASDDPAVAVLGATSGAKVITDANGTIQQYLRGLIYLLITSGQALVTATIAAGTSLIGKVASGLATDVIYNGTTALTPKFAVIAASSSGTNNLVAAVTSKQIRVLAYNFISNGTVNAKFQSDAGGTPVDLTGLKYCVANMGICAPFNPVGWFQSGVGKTLDLNLSAGTAVGGELVYVEV